MLRFLRSGGKHTKTIWWVIAIFTIVTFLGGFIFLFGAGFSSTARVKASGAVGSVNGQPITRADYQSALAEQRENYRRQYSIEPADRDERMIEIQTWRQMVAQSLFAEQARALNLVAHDREVVLALESNPPAALASQPVFQTDGKFDVNKYRNALRDPNNNWSAFEDMARQQLPVRKLQERLLASIKLSEPELQDAYRNQFEKLDGAVLQFVPGADVKVPAPSEADLQRAYLSYRGRFSSGPRAQLEVLVQPKKYGDEEMRTASEMARGLVSRARAGEDFAALARDFSEGPGADKGGEIPRLLQPAEFGQELAPRIAVLVPGEITDPFQDAGRFVILKLLGRVPPTGGQPGGMRLAQIVVKARPNESSLHDQLELLKKLSARSSAIGLGKAAAEKGLATSKTTYYNLDNIPPILYTTPEAADWGLGAKTGAVSSVFEGIDDFVIAQVAGRHEGGPPARDEIAEPIRQIAEMEQRIALSKPRADSVAHELAQGRTLEQAARLHGMSYFEIKGMSRIQPDPRLGAVPEVIGRMFVLAPGRVNGPMQALNGWYFMRTDRIMPANPAAYDTLKNQLTTEILTRKQQTFFAGFLGQLRAKAKIQDLRNDPNY